MFLPVLVSKCTIGSGCVYRSLHVIKTFKGHTKKWRQWLLYGRLLMNWVGWEETLFFYFAFNFWYCFRLLHSLNKTLCLRLYDLPSPFSTHVLSCVQLFATPWTVAHQAPPSVEFSRQEYWSGLPCPPPGNHPNPGIEPRSPTLQLDSLPSEQSGKPAAI